MFEPGTQVGRYEIQRRLGRGGMGTVYVAHDPVLGRMVAIKLFAGDLDVPDARERFSREARAAAALNHPNIVTVYDFGEFDSQPYIVMEYVAGETMANLIRRKVSVSMAEKLRWMEELCAGASYAHQMSVVHRDIKPANLMIDRAGRLKILDFGIARMLGIASNTSVMIGTPGYMAPEQITGDPVDHRSDQFSIGVVCYELLAYVEPFAGDTLPMITHRIVSQEPTPIEQLVPDARPELVTIVRTALKKSSAQRFKDADTMRLAISRVRREYDSDGDWNAPTMGVGRDLSPPAGGSRSTGSSRRRSNELVGVMTPPPDPRRTDREALARRRTAQLDAALALARTFLEQRQLDEALDACQQALTLDETHAGALALEQEIEIALRIRDGVESDEPAEALTTVDGPTLDPRIGSGRFLESQAITQFHDVALSPAATPEQRQTNAPPSTAGTPLPAHLNVNLPVDEKTAIRLPAAPIDATIVAPARRTPAPSKPAAPPAAAAVPAAPAAAVASAAPVAPVVAKAPEKPAPSAKGAVKKVEHRDWLAPLRDTLRSISPALGSNGTLLWGGVGAGVLAFAGVAMYLLTGGPVPTGATVIDAVPWANVVSVTNEDGEAQTLPSPASTPLVLALPAGTYQVTLTGPPPESKSETVSVRVEVGATNVLPAPKFRTLTVDEYFEPYIGVGDAPPPTPATETPEVTAAPAAAAPAGGPQ